MLLKADKTSPHWARPFFIIWVGQALSLVGSNLVQFALTWYLTRTTGSALVLASATFISLLPGVLLGPFAGALIDRWNRRLVMMIADSCVALATVVLVLLVWAGVVQIWHIYIILFIRAVGGTFHYPAMQASTSLMVPDSQLGRVAGMNQTLQGVLGIASPPLGALLMGLLPLYGVLAVDIVTAAMAVGTLFFISIPQPVRTEPQTKVTPRLVLSDVREGLRYVAAWPGLLIILIMATLLNFMIYPGMTLMPLLITQHFNGGVWHLGVIESAWSIGIVAGGLLLSAWGGFKKKIYTILLGVAVMGAGFLVIAGSPAWLFPLAVGGMFLSGFANPYANAPFMALLQSRVAPEMQGRVFTLVMSLTSAMSPISMLVAAPVANLIGLRGWFFLSAGFSLLMGAAGFFIRPLRRLEDESVAEPKVAPGLAPARE
jgi:DHA3 family macrolide efflux protein-like MFS transporter